MPEFPPMSLHLQTDRLTLRPWTDSDVDDYRALLAERGDGTPTVEYIRKRITNHGATAAQTGIALLAIERRDVGDFIGWTGLVVGRTSLAEPELAYELVRRVHSRGYATEAASAVVDAAIATGRERLWSTVGGWNTPSLRVLEKLGFDRDHVTNDDRGEIVWLTRRLVG